MTPHEVSGDEEPEREEAHPNFQAAAAEAAAASAAAYERYNAAAGAPEAELEPEPEPEPEPDPDPEPEIPRTGSIAPPGASDATSSASAPDERGGGLLGRIRRRLRR